MSNERSLQAPNEGSKRRTLVGGGSRSTRGIEHFAFPRPAKRSGGGDHVAHPPQAQKTRPMRRRRNKRCLRCRVPSLYLRLWPGRAELAPGSIRNSRTAQPLVSESDALLRSDLARAIPPGRRSLSYKMLKSSRVFNYFIPCVRRGCTAACRPVGAWLVARGGHNGRGWLEGGREGLVA